MLLGSGAWMRALRRPFLHTASCVSPWLPKTASFWWQAAPVGSLGTGLGATGVCVGCRWHKKGGDAAAAAEPALSYADRGLLVCARLLCGPRGQLGLALKPKP